MSRVDDLPPDQRATLSLLLRTRKSYAEVAGLLGIPEQAVHDRAHAALAVLAAPLARGLSAEQRAEVGDYLLGQRAGVGERLATRTYLDGSAPARAWASAIAAELAPLSDTPLPEIPADAPAAAEPTVSPSSLPAVHEPPEPAPASPREAAAPGEPAPPPRQPPSSPASSRRAGALLLAVIVVVAVVVIVLVTSGGGSSSSSKTSASSSLGTSSTGTGGTGTGGTSSTGSTGASGVRAKEDRRITLTSPDPASKAVGVAEVLSEGSQYAFYLAAEHLPPSKGFFYALWLYNSPTSFEALSRAPSVSSNGDVQGGALLPKDAGKYHTMLLTRETQSTPTTPGPVVLRGAFGLH